MINTAQYNFLMMLFFSFKLKSARYLTKIGKTHQKLLKIVKKLRN